MPDKQDKVTGRNNDPESNSGYTEDLDKDTNGSESTPIENTYSNLQEYYVSQSGHTRLFTATKYGKRYVLKCLKKDFLYTPVYQCLGVYAQQTDYTPGPQAIQHYDYSYRTECENHRLRTIRQRCILHSQTSCWYYRIYRTRTVHA